MVLQLNTAYDWFKTVTDVGAKIYIFIHKARSVNNLGL